MIAILRWILLPISLIYQFIVWLRNKMYDHNILKSQTFDTPTIVIGNLAVGGAGKSPMTEYLIRFLKDNYTIATLSRGYGRQTKGFRIVTTASTALEVGDEPLQFKKKFPDITVSVCEDRCTGIETLGIANDIILLDDAYQHRKLKAGFYILLFDFQSIFKPLLTLPTGNFRDNLSSIKRADLIVITKSPSTISSHQKKHIEKLIRTYSDSPIFYSAIQYQAPVSCANQHQTIKDLTGLDIVLFCGIANPTPLVEYLTNLGNRIHLLDFPDHYNYSNKDFQKVIAKYHQIASDNKVIITTEKDMQRIEKKDFLNLPLYYIPIQLGINRNDDNAFEYYIEKYISTVI